MGNLFLGWGRGCMKNICTFPSISRKPETALKCSLKYNTNNTKFNYCSHQKRYSVVVKTIDLSHKICICILYPSYYPCEPTQLYLCFGFLMCKLGLIKTVPSSWSGCGNYVKWCMLNIEKSAWVRESTSKAITYFGLPLFSYRTWVTKGRKWSCKQGLQ